MLRTKTSYLILLFTFSLLLNSSVGFAKSVTKELVQAEIKTMLPLTKVKIGYRYEVVHITEPVDGIVAAIIKPPHQEFPNVLFFKNGTRIKEGLGLGIARTSPFLDMHTKGLGVDFTVEVKSKSPREHRKMLEVVKKEKSGMSIIDYGEFFHMHGAGKSTYILDKSNYIELAKHIYGISFKKIEKHTCRNMGERAIVSASFTKEGGKYHLRAMTTGNQSWSVTFTGIEKSGRLRNKKVTALIQNQKEKFPLGSLKGLVRTTEIPVTEKAEVHDMAVPPVAAVLQWTKKVRKIQKKKKEFLKNRSKAHSGAKEFIALYSQETKFMEGNKSYWIPVQDQILGFLQEEVVAGADVQFQLRFLGSTQEREPIFMAVGFSSWPRQRVKKSTCFDSKYKGFKIGMDWVKANKLAASKLKLVKCLEKDRHNKVCAYVLDQKKWSLLYLGTAGGTYHQKLYSIQVGGNPNPSLVAQAGLKLGMTFNEIKKRIPQVTLGKVNKDGHQLVSIQNSSCSMQLKNKLLNSIYISDDPHYFKE